MVRSVNNFYKVCHALNINCTLVSRHGNSGAFEVSDIAQLKDYYHEGNIVFVGPYYDRVENRVITPKTPKIPWEQSYIAKLIERGIKYKIVTRRVCDSNELIADSNLGVHGWTLLNVADTEDVEGKNVLVKNGKTVSFAMQRKATQRRIALCEQRILMLVWQHKSIDDTVAEWCALNERAYKKVVISTEDTEGMSVHELLMEGTK